MTSELLERYRFDEALFEGLRRRVAAGELSSEANRLSATVEPPRAGDLVRLPGRGEAEFDAAFEEGFAAYARGEVAVAVLNGGMATRFGGVVKGVVEAHNGHIRYTRSAMGGARFEAWLPLTQLEETTDQGDDR